MGLIRPSQITKTELPFELAKGLYRSGVMDIAEPQRSQIP
jgi:hypothetical protein